MLNLEQQGEGDIAIKDMISQLTDKPCRSFVIKKCIVTALVNNELIVDAESIECHFQIEKNYSIVNIYWEESGYKHYRKLGLYGQMRTDYQLVTSQGAGHICIRDQQNTYKVIIKY